MSQPHKHRDVIIAWANGETVEYKVGETWYDVLNPAWDEEIEYRIKPKIVKREGWINIWIDMDHRYGGKIHNTREEAEEIKKDDCRAYCCRIEWEEEE